MRRPNLTTTLVLLISLALVLLLIITIGRSVPYADISFTSIILQEHGAFQLLIDDPFSSGQVLQSTPYDLLIIILGKLIPLSFLQTILPILFGLGFLFLFSLVLQEKKVPEDMMIVALFITIFTPIFIFSSTLNNPFSSLLLLNALGILLFLRKRHLGALLIYIVLALYGFPYLLLSLIILGISIKKLTRTYFITVILSGIIGIFLTLPLFSQYSFSFSFLLANVLSELGGHGVGIFGLILAIMGWTSFWKSYKARFLILLILFTLSFFIPTILVFILPFLALLGGAGIVTLSKKEWALPTLKQLTLLALVLGILFSSLSYETRILEELPNEDIILGLEQLQKITTKGDIILSHTGRGLWIEAVAKRPALIDKNSFIDPSPAFNTYSFNQVSSFLKEHNVAYIFIDRKMKEGLVWEKAGRELLFVLEQSNSFELLYENEEVEVWHYIT